MYVYTWRKMKCLPILQSERNFFHENYSWSGSEMRPLEEAQYQYPVKKDSRMSNLGQKDRNLPCGKIGGRKEQEIPE